MRGSNKMANEIKAYAAHKIVNAALTASGIDKKIPPQMMYNYANKENKEGLNYFGEKKGIITDESLAKWLEKYIAKAIAASYV